MATQVSRSRKSNHPAATARRRRPVRPRSGARRGAAVLELAVLLPVLLSVALLAVDFGRFAYWYIAVTNAARAGAGVGSANPNGDMQQAVKDELGLSNWSAPEQAKLTIGTPVITYETDALGHFTGCWRAEIDVTYNFKLLINWPFLWNYNEPVALHRKVVMRGS
jgi:Flp pilus assembly protein TadG